MAYDPQQLTTKGDIGVYSTKYTRLGVGTDTQVLTADSTQPTGLKWGSASVSQYAEMLTTVSGNTDVIYKDGTNPVPDFIVDNNGDFVMRLVTI